MPSAEEQIDSQTVDRDIHRGGEQVHQEDQAQQGDELVLTGGQRGCGGAGQGQPDLHRQDPGLAPHVRRAIDRLEREAKSEERFLRLVASLLRIAAKLALASGNIELFVTLQILSGEFAASG